MGSTSDIDANQRSLNELTNRLENVIQTGRMNLEDSSELAYTTARKTDWNMHLDQLRLRASQLYDNLVRLHGQVPQTESPDLKALQSQYDLINDYIGLLLYEGDLKDIEPLTQLESRLETYNDRFTHHGKLDLFKAWETRLSDYHAIIEFIKAYSAEKRSTVVRVDREYFTLHSLDRSYRPTISAIVAQYRLDWLQNPSALKTTILKNFQAWKQEIDRLQRALTSTEAAKTQANLSAANLKKQLAILTLYEQYLATKPRPTAPTPVASSSSSASASASAAPGVVINDATVNAFINAHKDTLYTYIKVTKPKHKTSLEVKSLSNLSNKKAQIKELLQKSDETWITDVDELAKLKGEIETQFSRCEAALNNPRISEKDRMTRKDERDALIIKLIILDNYKKYLEKPKKRT